MSINNIDLSSHLLQSLYASTLVDTGEKPSATSVPKLATPEKPAVEPVLVKEVATTVPAANLSKEIKYLGKNSKQLLVVVNYTDHLHIPDDSLQFLTQLLSAIKMNIGDIALVNFANHSHIPYKEWVDFLNSQHVFLFGVEPAAWGLPINFPHFQVQSFAGLQLIHAPSLEALQGDKLLKTKLWMNLKTVFGV